jgi:hypothetical protein
MDIEHIRELARSAASPAVSVLLPIEQPVSAHPETPLRLRALIDEAVRSTATWWDADAAGVIRAQFDAAAPTIAPGEQARGLAVFVSPDDRLVLRLPFRVEEEVIVDSTYATRQLFEGWARRLRYRAVVLDADGARLLEGEGDDLTDVAAHGFPVRVERPTEQDTPHRDRPRHESVREEDRRVVERRVGAALASAHRADPRPVVLIGEERRLSTLVEVAAPSDVAGVVHGDHRSATPEQLAGLIRPVLDGWQAESISVRWSARGPAAPSWPGTCEPSLRRGHGPRTPSRPPSPPSWPAPSGRFRTTTSARPSSWERYARGSTW